MKEEEIPEESEASKSYNQEEWERLRTGRTYYLAIQKGREMGVPEEELGQFAQEVIAEKTEEQDYGFVSRFMTSLGIGTEEELRNVRELEYQKAFADQEFMEATSLAKELFGEDSPEYKKAKEASEKQEQEREKREMEREGEEEKEWYLVLPPEATFADLFAARDAIEEREGLGVVHLEEEVWDNFDPEVAEEIFAFQDTQASQAGETKLTDFFREHGYTPREIEIFLPIKFKRKIRKNR